MKEVAELAPRAPAEVDTGSGVVRFDAGNADVKALTRLVRGGARTANEQFDADAHLDEVVPKPWGYEYRAYVDEFFDFWALHISPPHSTSVHVHPRKLTYLICLGGRGVTTGLDRAEVPVRAGTVLRIAPGAFHGTRNTGDEPLELIEVEVPRNKFDLIRLADDYSRTGQGYETESRQADQHPMRRIPSFPNARMRDRAPDGRFRFELRTGMDLFYRRRPEDLFHVPLCMAGVVHSDVTILTGHADDRRRPQTDLHYLSISRAA
ncbi:mannose-6-phosphate isomerase-like protein (cupin superfamily) [Saccharothrix ecbatanensis]|jgi:mannose-6-phosphate isomerase-like protein (cupin superfamily)|uniref:Mannose-6-phosphate isomerase-like protein (Cupin superfamily) n=1 Tax=Saccharothrix ecbatanensis TaxID=1105145 RepID=A0A7W9HH69_9PSEU|nr:cupin domain-containing protein [Saccharothrix ecbatanensis]MBB5801878.1 mannose-6-phosphate isomerase-like protein (cupin superfamily) [Saccharothrix ecbatanensis]